MAPPLTQQFKELRYPTPRFMKVENTFLLLPECTDLTIVNTGENPAQLVNRFDEVFEIEAGETVSIGLKSTIDQMRVDATNTVVKLIYFT